MSIPIVSRCVDVSFVQKKFVKRKVRKTKNTIEESYTVAKSLHSIDDKPALSIVSKNFAKGRGEKLEEWYDMGKLHREGGPSRIKISYSESSRKGVGIRIIKKIEKTIKKYDIDFSFPRTAKDFIYEQNWYLNNKLHREEGPSFVSIKRNSITLEWHAEGKLHRKDGPSHVFIYDQKGTIISDSSWYEHGKWIKTKRTESIKH